MKDKHLLVLLIMMIFTMNMVLAQNKQEPSPKKEYKASITKSIQKDIDKLLKEEFASRDAEYPERFILESFALNSPVAQLDIEKINKCFKKLTSPRNNFKNQFRLNHHNLDVLEMVYNMSGDIWFLNKMV
ncbi:hypothetical protein ACFFU9_15300 [Mariniflexile ostreae]|uniref:Uncharacterized protein n=1 Tax=Mariniflexile ostreae TaxID=1520892 RepID=A0ABV5FFH7_9FLAO